MENKKNNIQDKIEKMKEQNDLLQEEIKTAQSNISRLEGEMKQIRAQKKQLEDKAQQEFGCSIKELKAKIKQWIPEWDTLSENIKEQIDKINSEISDEEGTDE